MATCSISEVKTRLSRMLRDLDHGEEVIIMRRGRPCGRLTAVGLQHQRQTLPGHTTVLTDRRWIRHRSRTRCALGAPVMTRDEALATSDLVPTVW